MSTPPKTPKTKELRLALVCYGGISLAIYMHGVTKEIWKLLRASRAFHTAPDGAEFSAANPYDDPTDTEAVYFDLLREIGSHVKLRVLVDIIAGASAGGINGVMLAKAIADGSSLEPHRSMWLDNADVEELLDPAARSNRWSKFYMRPVLWLWNRLKAGGLEPEFGRKLNEEMHRKLSLFVRSRWFKPPFSGVRFARMLLDGLEQMPPSARKAAPCAAGEALLPPGVPLDLFVTVTDYFGYRQRIRMHSPPEVVEREHRMIFTFRDPGRDPGQKRSLGSNASLAFAARATASFPGVFPAATFAEMDQAVQESGLAWADRATLIGRLADERGAPGDPPERSAYLDGSVLNNKPFGEAIAALRSRPASREVDRRIVYLEPLPLHEKDDLPGAAPGFFSSIRASISTIPRNQPIRDELAWAQDFSYRVRRFKAVITSIEPDVAAAVQAALGPEIADARITPDALKVWRDTANMAAAAHAGFTYGAYVELKLIDVLEHLADLIGRLAAPGRIDPVDPALRERVQAWARRSGVLNGERPGEGVATGEHLPWVAFLKRYDLPFRERRLRFMVRRLNRLYTEESASDPAALDYAKARFYEALHLVEAASAPDRFHAGLRVHAVNAASGADPDGCIAAIGEVLNLHDLDLQVDALVAAALSGDLRGDLHSACRQALLFTYLGYAFMDAATLPLLEGRDLDEFDEIKVDRISPDDSQTLRPGGADATLKGLELNLFGGFFSRVYRENDYLWGRLHGAERMIDIVLSSVSGAVAFTPEQKLAFKQRAFSAILNAEARHLSTADRLICDLLEENARLGGGHGIRVRPLSG
ncbi:MAG: patatin-like protein [Sphingomonadales bacterium]|nr:MAG: patatin-like protein [Sphingomonadales bacterium]